MSSRLVFSDDTGFKAEKQGEANTGVGSVVFTGQGSWNGDDDYTYMAACQRSRAKPWTRLDTLEIRSTNSGRQRWFASSAV